MLIPSKTDIVIFILRLVIWIYYLIFSIYVIFIIFNTSNCWIDLNAVVFDTVYPFFWFWSAQIGFLFLSSDVLFSGLAFCVVADRFKEIPLWSWSNSIFISEGVFLRSFNVSSSHDLAYSRMVFYSVYILTVSVFLVKIWLYSNLILQLLHYL